jgi:hypothetical protein
MAFRSFRSIEMTGPQIACLQLTHGKRKGLFLLLSVQIELEDLMLPKVGNTHLTPSSTLGSTQFGSLENVMFLIRWACTLAHKQKGVVVFKE